jgi:hypothetical protein
MECGENPARLSSATDPLWDHSLPVQSAAEYWPTSAEALESASRHVESYDRSLGTRACDMNIVLNLLSQPLSNNPWLLSRQRAELQNAHDELLNEFLASLPSNGDDSDDHLIEPAGLCYWENEQNRRVLIQILDDRIPTDPTGPALIQLTHLQAAFLWAFLSVRWHAARQFLRQLVRSLVLKKLRLATLLLSWNTAALKPRFCCVSWARRAWFILHGSHPPKPEPGPSLDLTFGCA